MYKRQRLVHPHILPLYDSGDAEGLLYHVTPSIDGETLRDRLKRERYLPIEEAVRITAEVADALDFAHTQGVIHRDIKPENILLTHRHVFITDFGIARAITLGGGDRLTETGMAVGTPAYMSPEQARGEAELDGRSDIYSLACVTYEMLAGEAPLAGRSPMITMTRRQEETPTSLNLLRETVLPPLDAAVLKALARLPADRYSTAGQFGEAGHVAYSASKAALRGVVRSLKNEIVHVDPAARVNLVDPGWTRTPMAEGAMEDAAAVERALATTPLRRVAEPEDVASTCVFLASPTRARHLTGQIVGVHGGMEGRRLW